jgi:UDP-glucuronate decarboxylase
MKILVTGGTGFLGSNLCKALVENGDDVVCLDNNYTGRMENIANLIDKPNFMFIEKDVCEPLKVKGKFDQIYNLACPASPPAYQGKHSIETTRTCVLGAMNMLELAKEHGATILQTSTSEVYGDPLVHPQTEEYRGNVNPIGIRSCYDEGKRCAESLFFDYNRHEGVNIKVVRIFNTYGVNMDKNDGRVVSNFINQALNGEDITIYGDGTQTRSFCYVDDLIKGLVKMMNSPKEVTGPVNLGNPGEFTMLELAKLTLEKINSKSNIVYRPLPKDDPTRRKPDITKAKTILGWEPKISLSEGLDKTIEYFKGIKKNEKITTRKAYGFYR